MIAIRTIVFGLIGAFLPLTATAQRAGERVLITVTYETKVKTEKVDKVFAGQIKTITSVNGNWCGLEDVQGWLPLRYAMNLQSAVKFYNERIAAKPGDAEAFATRGLLMYELGQHDKALGDFTQALRIDARAVVPWNNRAMVFMADGKWNEALRDVSQAIGINPKFTDAYVNRSLIYSSLAKFDEAIKDIEKAIELEPKNSQHYVRRGSIAFDQGNLDGAWADFDKAAAINPRLTDVYLGRGNVLLSRGKLEEAIVNARRAVELSPNSTKAHNLLGWLQFESKQPQEAVNSFGRAINLDSEFAIAYSNRGVAKVELGQVDDAIKDYNRAIELDKNGTLTYCNRGTAWMNKANFAKAQADFEQSLKLAPSLPETLNVYAWFLSTCTDEKFRDGKRAVEMAEKAVAASSQPNWYRVDTLAAAKAEVGEFDKAIELQQQAIEKAPADKKEACQTRLQSYQDKKPIRSEFGKSAAVDKKS